MANERSAQCIFCSAVEQEDGAQNLIIYRGKRAFVILNRYPYTNGHLMVVPYDHIATLDALDSATSYELMDLINHSIQTLRTVYMPEAFNLGANIGAAAGAGVVDHFHFHIVPRWHGDTNFMSTIGSTRVLPEELPETLVRLVAAWK